MTTLKQPKTIMKKLASGLFGYQRDPFCSGHLFDRSTGKVVAVVDDETAASLENNGLICITGRPSESKPTKYRLTKKGLAKVN